MCLVFPTLVKGIHTDKDIAEAFAPSCHIFYADRVIDVSDGKPKWSGHKVCGPFLLLLLFLLRFPFLSHVVTPVDMRQTLNCP